MRFKVFFLFFLVTRLLWFLAARAWLVVRGRRRFVEKVTPVFMSRVTGKPVKSVELTALGCGATGIIHRIVCDNGESFVLKELGEKNQLMLLLSEMAETEFLMHTTFEDTLAGVKPRCVFAAMDRFTQETAIICEDLGHLEGGAVPEEGLSPEVLRTLVRGLAQVRRQTVARVAQLQNHPVLGIDPRSRMLRMVPVMWKSLSKKAHQNALVETFVRNRVVTATMQLVSSNLDLTIELLMLNKWNKRFGLCHPDPRSDNAFWGKNDECSFIDWGSTYYHGPFCKDLAWLLSWDCDTKTRRVVETECLEEMLRMAVEVDPTIVFDDVRGAFHS